MKSAKLREQYCIVLYCIVSRCHMNLKVFRLTFVSNCNCYTVILTILVLVQLSYIHDGFMFLHRALWYNYTTQTNKMHISLINILIFNFLMSYKCFYPEGSSSGKRLYVRTVTVRYIVRASVTGASKTHYTISYHNCTYSRLPEDEPSVWFETCRRHQKIKN
jgi:hypothetical protein